jgi:Protein of unknown function (DUF2909)
MRVVVIGLLIAIICSLGSAAFFLIRDQGTEQYRVVKALSLRVGLSVLLFVMLIAGHYLGWIAQPL